MSDQHAAKPLTNGSAPQTTSNVAHLINYILIFIGISAILAFVLGVMQDSGIQFVLDWVPSEEYPNEPSLILAFLERFGIVVPILVIGGGIAFINLGIKLRSRNIGVAHWAAIALLWLSVGAGAYIFFSIFNFLTLDDDETIELSQIISDLLLPFILLMVSGSLWHWLKKNIETAFSGADLLMARESRLAWNLLIPTLVIFLLVAARPLEQTFLRSLTDKRFAGGEVPQFVGLDNYTNLLGFRIDTVPCRLDDTTGDCSVRNNGSIRWESIDRELLQDGYRTVWNLRLPFTDDKSTAISGLDDDFLLSIYTTLLFTVVSVSLELLIGLFMALAVNSPFKGRGFMRAVMLVPWAIPTVISARLWELILKDTSAGILNRVLMDVGMIDAPKAWLSEASLQLPTAIIVDVWKTAPFIALLLLAGLQTISKDLYEAASVDGASPVRRFFAITLPLLRPAIAIALVFRTLDALRVFDLFNVLFGRQQLSMATYNFEMLVTNQQDGYASAVSVIIFIFISIFAFIYVRMLNVET